MKQPTTSTAKAGPITITVAWLLNIALNLFDSIITMFCLAIGLMLTIRRHGIASSGYRQTMSSDTMSSLYPDRPIRPLPKRRLRERLSPEVVDSIKYPSAPETNQPLFYYPYDQQDSPSSNRASTGTTPDRTRVFRRNGISTSTDSDEEEGPRTVAIPWPSPQVSPRLGRKEALAHHSAAGNAAASSTSSADGYDSLENTNNNKKRKIPSPGDHVLNGGHTLSEISNLSISHPLGSDARDGASASPGHYGGSASGFMSSSQGISGPGRGRFGRSRNGRSPLRALSDSSSNWAGRTGKIRPLHFTQPQDHVAAEGSGIISSAIANAEKLAHPQGQENISLLQQTGNSKSSPASSLFTFTCESQVNSSVAWPASDTASSSIQSPSSKSSTAHNMQSTQTSPPRAGSSFDHKDAVHPGNAGAETTTPRRKHKSKAARRQKLDRELQRQAEERRHEAQMRNRDNNNNNHDDGYICLYCEYETLFGEMPWALIRQYELKDRQRRKAEAERKRLIEKAKNRSRKNRKAAGKATAKGNNGAAQNYNQSTNSTHPDHLTAHDRPDDTTDDLYGEEADEAGIEYVDHDADERLDDKVGSDHGHGKSGKHGHGHDHVHGHSAIAGGGVVGGRGGIHPQPLQSCTCARA